MSAIDVAIVGATGAVGEVVVELLAKRKFPVDKLYLLASERTAGTSLLFNGSSVRVEELKHFDFALVKLAIFVATDDVSTEYIPKAQAADCLVIDNSQAFSGVAPLVVPGVNDEILQAEPRFVVNPDSDALLLASVLKPILGQVGLKHINITALHSASGKGKKAIHELATQTAGLLNGRGAEPKVFPKQLAFNVLPATEEQGDQGYTVSEERVFNQLRRLLGDMSLAVNGFCLQAPVFYSDSLVVNIETERPLSVEQAKQYWQSEQNITLMDGAAEGDYATAVSDATGQECIFISRVTQDFSRETGINFWLVADNVRKSAAFNTILIAEELIKSYL